MQVTMLLSLWRDTAVPISLRQLLYSYISLQSLDKRHLFAPPLVKKSSVGGVCVKAYCVVVEMMTETVTMTICECKWVCEYDEYECEYECECEWEYEHEVMVHGYV